MIFSKKNQAALRPPMGWNSWDCFASMVTEEQLLAAARYMHDNLQAFGYEYVVCDIQWSDPHDEGTDIVYRPFAELALDEYGRQIPAVNRFPSSADGSGFKHIADQVHELGLKFGIHIMRGIPRYAVHRHLPVLGTEVTADMVADPHSICQWNGDMYGIRDCAEGQAYYNSIFDLYASWGVDFVKVDDICHEHLYPAHPYGEHEVAMMRRAIDRTGRPMVLSLSPGPAVIEKAWHLSANANMWRITDDFWDDWKLLKAMFERCEVWQAHVGPGCWPDCDMLPLGRIGTGFGYGRDSGFTKAEQRTVMTLWSVFRSPLIMGGDMSVMDDWTLSLLTNKEVLAANQTGAHPLQLSRTDAEASWTSEAADGGRYLALFNLSDEDRTVSQCLSVLEQDFTSAKELWTGEAVDISSGKIGAVIEPHGARMYKLS